jgi:hypothetical protein
MSSVLTPVPAQRVMLYPRNQREFEPYRDHDVFQMSSALSLLHPDLFMLDVEKFIAERSLRYLNEQRLLVVILGIGRFSNPYLHTTCFAQHDTLAKRLRTGQLTIKCPILFLGSTECVPHFSVSGGPPRGFWVRRNLETLLENQEQLRDSSVYYSDILTPDNLLCQFRRMIDGSVELIETPAHAASCFELLPAAIFETLSICF